MLSDSVHTVFLFFYEFSLTPFLGLMMSSIKVKVDGLQEKEVENHFMGYSTAAVDSVIDSNITQLIPTASII